MNHKTFNALKDELHKSSEKLLVHRFGKSEKASRKGGAKKRPFQAAMEKAYLYFQETEKSYILGRGKVVLFIEEIAGLMNRTDKPCPKNEREIINQLEELILPPKKTMGAWKITTQEFQEKKPRGRTIVHKSKTYESKYVSKQLTLLRKEYPLLP